MPSSKLLIFGGSFDPIHIGHTNALLSAINLIVPDFTYIVPNYITPDKTVFHSSAQQRLKMINLAIEGIEGVEVSDYEINQNKSVKTIETILHFRELYTDWEIYLLIGSDQLHNFENWYDYKKILKNAKLVVYPRDGYELIEKNFSYIKIDGVINNISSSELRHEVKPYQLNEKVLNYINDYGIYGIERIKKFESEARFNHSLRVAFMARELMNIYDSKLSHLAYTAGLYHDIAKEMNPNEQVFIAKNILGIQKFDSYKILHGYIGSYLIKSKFLFNNKYILNAIDRHTLPFDYFDTEPNLLDKVLYIADKLEPNRTNDDVFGKSIDYYRDLAKKDINQCFLELYNWLQQNLKRNK